MLFILRRNFLKELKKFTRAIMAGIYCWMVCLWNNLSWGLNTHYLSPVLPMIPKTALSMSRLKEFFITLYLKKKNFYHSTGSGKYMKKKHQCPKMGTFMNTVPLKKN